jgi:hypothetical protein
MVYRATVLVERNPLSGKPHVVLAAGMNRGDTRDAARLTAPEGTAKEGAQP